MKIGTGKDEITIIDFPGNEERPRMYPGLYVKNSSGKWYWFLPVMGITKLVRTVPQIQVLDAFLEERSRKGS